MEVKRKSRRDYDKPARQRRDYDGKPTKEGRKFDGKPSSIRNKKEGRNSHEGFESHKPKFEGKPKFEAKTKFEGKPRFEGKPKFEGKTAKKKAVPAASSTEVRLNKFIANSGVCSRREADRLIQAGVVTVNGKVVTELGVKIDTRKDTVLFGGQKLQGEEKVYIVMNKPKGFVTTTSDPHADQTVMDLLTKCPTRVFPVGRLDKNTTGVLMFTNDGEMAERLTHPSFNKKKIYEVTLDRKLTEEDFDKILSGIKLEDGIIKADELDYVDPEDKRKIGIEIHSGRNRIVRRIFEYLDYQVKGLDRVYFAGLTKKGIKRGAWRYLTEGEVNILKMGAFN